MNFLSTTGLPAWVVPGLIVHIALFLTMIVPAWRGFAYARLGGPVSLVLAIPSVLAPSPFSSSLTRTACSRQKLSVSTSLATRLTAPLEG